MARQRLADETDPLRFRAVIEEYVLDRIAGGPPVMGHNWNTYSP